MLGVEAPLRRAIDMPKKAKKGLKWPQIMLGLMFIKNARAHVYQKRSILSGTRAVWLLTGVKAPMRRAIDTCKMAMNSQKMAKNPRQGLINSKILIFRIPGQSRL